MLWIDEEWDEHGFCVTPESDVGIPLSHALYGDPYDVPDELARRWLAAQAAWNAAHEEIGRFLESHFPIKRQGSR